jgi:hypothetical protein
MRITYLLIFFTLVAYAQKTPRIEVIPNPQSIEDFDHQFKGCPENSECDQVMGHMLERWKNLILKLKALPETSKSAALLEAYRVKYGIPNEFYTYQKSQQGFKPALHSSPCKEHNPKVGEKILKGTAFMKSITLNEAIIWRDQSQIELPLKENIHPQPVKVYFEKGAISYNLALNDQPLFIKNKELYVLKDADDFYYMLKISPNGDWKIIDMNFSNLSQWEDKRSNVDCPADQDKANPVVFSHAFCKTVWDETEKKLVTVRMHQGCSI